MELNKVYCENNLETMARMSDNFVHAIVTDAPYGINFMGKKWDYDVPDVETWKECLRVLKPGGYLLSFAGTRTQHRMAVNIEDAGFEIRDMIAWVYGSGFPKSHNVGKAVDGLQGNDREVVGYNPNKRDSRSNIVNVQTEECIITKGSSEWEGWGTALKPAMEPITVARKPFNQTVAENVLEHGTGGINIDDCRVEINPEIDDSRLGGKGYWASGKMAKNVYNGGYSGKKVGSSDKGRFPANFIHDGSNEVRECFPDTESGFMKQSQKRNQDGGYHGGFPQDRIGDRDTYGDAGSAARFFYCAKASKSERGKGNNHETVKPIRLMRYLVRLVTPPGGIVYDPYGGSGTTAIAAGVEGFDWILSEDKKEYVKIIHKRVKRYLSQQQLF